MTSEIYLCHDCCDSMGIKSNEIAINECHRKSCHGCGDTSDWRLHYMDIDKFNDLLDEYKRR